MATEPLYNALLQMKLQDKSVGTRVAESGGAAIGTGAQAASAAAAERFRQGGANNLFKAAQEAGLDAEKYFLMGQSNFEAAEKALAEEVRAKKLEGYVGEIGRQGAESMQKALDAENGPITPERVAELRESQRNELAGRRMQARSTTEIDAIDKVLGPSAASGDAASARAERNRIAEDASIAGRKAKAHTAVMDALNKTGAFADYQKAQVLAKGLESIKARIAESLQKDTLSDMARVYSVSDMSVSGGPVKTFVQDAANAIKTMGWMKGDTQATYDNLLSSSDTQDKLRASIAVMVLNHLRAISGAAVTDSEAQRLLQDVLNKRSGLGGVLRGTNELVRQAYEKAGASVMAAEGLTANSLQEYVPEEMAALRGAFGSMPTLVDEELISQLDSSFGKKVDAKPGAGGGATTGAKFVPSSPNLTREQRQAEFRAWKEKQGAK